MSDSRHGESFQGQCFCGHVHYKMTARPMFVHACHCRDCQRQTGGAFAINAIVEGDRVDLTAGDTVVVTLPTESGHPHDVHRCPLCQTALWSDYGRRGWLKFLRVTTLENPAEFTPDVHIYTRSKLPCVILPEAAHAFEAYYDMKSEWPPESLARREAARAKAKMAG